MATRMLCLLQAGLAPAEIPDAKVVEIMLCLWYNPFTKLAFA